jgi:D-3-phosphoglycerate dehydrogenase
MDSVVYTGPAASGEIVKKLLGGRLKVEIVEATPESLLPKFRECAFFLDASMKVPLNREAIASAPNLKMIVTATTGADHIDKAALDERGIPLRTLKGQKEVLNGLTAAAELSWLLLMTCARKLRGAIRHVENGGWERTEFPGAMLKGKTLGVIGIGRIGGWMSRYAQAFGMSVQAFDPFTAEFPQGVRKADLDELLSTSDFITVHVNLTPETKGLLSADKIRLFKPGATFVNTSRGEIADEAALLEGLEGGRIGAVGVDVLIGEPDIRNNRLWQFAQSHDNVVITPHIGGFCPEAVDHVVRFSCERILKFLDGDVS